MDSKYMAALKEAMKTRPELGEVSGILVLKGTCEIWNKIWKFEAQPDDVLICGYPKTGSTWLNEIVDLIRHDGDAEKCKWAPVYNRIPTIEVTPPKPLIPGLEKCEALPFPRTIRSHLPIQMIPPSFWEKNCKVIYIARNAKDTLVSYYYFQKMQKLFPEPGTWDEFFEAFLVGKVMYGSWFDHVKGWWDARERRRILYVFYEDMKEDRRREIQKIVQFLEKDLEEDILEKIIQDTSFQAMKGNPLANHSTVPSFLHDQSVYPFMRKGKIGDWKNHFTVAQNERFDKEYMNKMSESSLSFCTEP